MNIRSNLRRDLFGNSPVGRLCRPNYHLMVDLKLHIPEFRISAFYQRHRFPFRNSGIIPPTQGIAQRHNASLH